MLVDFIIPTYDRIDALRMTLSSLIVQTNNDWCANVVVDRPYEGMDKLWIDICTDAMPSDVRIRYTFMEKRYNDWGHTPREIGKQASECQYIIMTGDDNYYMPTFVEELRNASFTSPGVIYWDMIHSHYNYQYFKCAPGNNQIDMGAFATRRDIAQNIKLNTTYAADGEYIESIKAKYPKEEMIKIFKVLFVHN